jgi:hypothetical protein
LADIVSKPFTFVCNFSLASGMYPERFKFAIVCPVHKNGGKTKINYKPISLLIYFSKISETLMFSRLNHYL